MGMRILSRSRRKAMTPFVLALWLFALAASIAHACGLDDALGRASLGLKTLKAVEDSPAGVALLVPASESGAPVVAYPRTIEVRSGSNPPPDLAINTRFVRLAL